MNSVRSSHANDSSGGAPRATERDLRALQRLMFHALVRPLTDDDALQPRWHDGRPMEEVASEFIRPNDRLTAFERLQIYSRSYWFRLIDCVHEDCPGVRSVIGDEKFSRLIRAYLARYPSRSFTLRNLSSRLAGFIVECPALTAPHTALAAAVARFEWAQTVAFDGEARPPLTQAAFVRTPPDRLRLGLQPYLSLVQAEWPLDDYVLAVKKRDALRTETSNAIARGARRTVGRKVRHPVRSRTYLVIHRYQNRIYYKRVEAAAFRILSRLGRGETLQQALAGSRARPAQVQSWFATWMELGWFCRRSSGRSSAAKVRGPDPRLS